MTDASTSGSMSPGLLKVAERARQEPQAKFHSLAHLMNGEAKVILEADIQTYFDSLDRSRLMEFLRERIPDGSITRLVGKCLHVGVLDGEEFSTPDRGTAQGSCLSPLLGNLYLHHVLDEWFEVEIRPRLRSRAVLVRYCDDFVIGFERMEDAERVRDVLDKRLGKYGLTLQPDKTRLIPFERPSQEQTKGKGPGTFDLLGYTFFWRRAPNGRWVLTCKTRRDRLKRSIQALYRLCRCHRNWPIPAQHADLVRRIQGHINYFGISGNGRSVAHLVTAAMYAWYKWLNRRSQRSRMTWERYYHGLLRQYPLPRPRVVASIWFKPTVSRASGGA